MSRYELCFECGKHIRTTRKDAHACTKGRKRNPMNLLGTEPDAEKMAITNRLMEDAVAKTARINQICEENSLAINAYNRNVRNALTEQCRQERADLHQYEFSAEMEDSHLPEPSFMMNQPEEPA